MNEGENRNRGRGRFIVRHARTVTGGVTGLAVATAEGRVHAAPVATVERAFVFADLSGYTALTEAHGDEDAAAVSGRFAGLARIATEGSGELVKTIGDAVMLALHDAASAIRTACMLRDLAHREHRFPGLRIGMHYGTAVEQNGDYFGSTVNLAARVAAHAKVGQVLCTESVVASSANLIGVEYRLVGDVPFKNVAMPVRVFELLLPDAGAAAIDPVCRMRVDDANAFTIEVDGRRVVFCSEGCSRLFADAPERYGR